MKFRGFESTDPIFFPSSLTKLWSLTEGSHLNLFSTSSLKNKDTTWDPDFFLCSMTSILNRIASRFFFPFNCVAVPFNCEASTNTSCYEASHSFEENIFYLFSTKVNDSLMTGHCGLRVSFNRFFLFRSINKKRKSDKKRKQKYIFCSAWSARPLSPASLDSMCRIMGTDFFEKKKKKKTNKKAWSPRSEAASSGSLDCPARANVRGEVTKKSNK